MRTRMMRRFSSASEQTVGSRTARCGRPDRAWRGTRRTRCPYTIEGAARPPLSSSDVLRRLAHVAVPQIAGAWTEPLVLGFQLSKRSRPAFLGRRRAVRVLAEARCLTGPVGGAE